VFEEVGEFGLPVSRAFGTWGQFVGLNPTLKRWAIFDGPSGTGCISKSKRRETSASTSWDCSEAKAALSGSKINLL
jgi:hypothetical protein